MWGTGASSTQTEGAAPASDWLQWEAAGHAPASGDGNGFARRYAEDFAQLADLGLTHHRLSIEWARMEPEQGVHDAAAVEHYRKVLSTAREAGITSWLCLHHFTLPAWLADQGGFLVERNRTEHWARHVDFMAETFGDLAGGWKPVNEHNFWPIGAYGGGGLPPGHHDREERAMVTEAIHLATAEAAVRLRATGAPVASVFSLSTEVALDDDDATKAIVQRLRTNGWDIGLGLYRDGVLAVPGRDPVERPDLAGSFDLLGFSYYATIGVRQGRIVPYPEDGPRSPLGYTISANGLRLVLERLASEVPGTPLLVAEYGIGTDDDSVRAEYLRTGLQIVHDAIAAGIDVRGFFHWTAVDNYEWLHGYDVSFGLIDRERNVRPSAQVLREQTGAS
jgi:beta-glucosidase